MTKPRRTLESRGKSTSYVTTGGAGYIPNSTVSPVDMLRQKIYKSVSPNDSYNLDDFFTQLLSDNDVYKDYKNVFDSTDRFYPEDETNKAHRQSYNIADEMLATYLSIPKKDRHSSIRLKKSKYQDAYALPLHESMKKNIIDETNDLSIGKNKSVILNGPIGLGYTAVGKGYDNKGEYRSYGDRYDLNPARGKLKSINIPFLESIGDVSMGIGKPFDIYDRIYLDDYYGVKEPTHATYFPEVTITGRKKYEGGGATNIEYEKDWSDKVEPYAAGVGLAGDAIGLGAAATGVGIPVGTAIAGIANIPNLIVDGYQTGRDIWRSFNDDGNSLGSAAWNGGELLLDITGLKALRYINEARKAGVSAEKIISSMERKATHPYRRVGTGASRSRLRKAAENKTLYNAGRREALKESNEYLAKRGVRAAQGEYYYKKLADEMAKRGYGVSVNDAIKSANRTARQNLGIISGVSGGINIYHISK